MYIKITDLIQEFSKNHLAEISQSYHATLNTKIITKQLPSILADELYLDHTYKVYGSVGSGNWSEIPWIGILDKSITTSTTKGYYLVLLLDKNLENLYLGLSVGWTQFEEEFGITEGKIKIRGLCDHYARLLKNKPSGFQEGIIDLGAENNLGKGYERGSILSKKYSISAITDEILIEDLKVLHNSYEELKQIVGDSILNLEIDYAEYDQRAKEFKKEVAAASLRENTIESIEQLIEKANEAPPEVRMKLTKEIVRNKKFADFIKKRANFICEICKQAPFIQKNGKPYAEADHITPLGGDTKGLDSPDNMRCLCAQCHAVITHGSVEEIKNLLKIKS